MAFKSPFGVIAGLFAAVFIHEAGHIVAGLAQGFKIELMTVGCFGLMRTNGKLRPFFNRNLQYFGGVAATSPSVAVKDPR